MKIVQFVALICLFPLSALSAEPALSTASELNEFAVPGTSTKTTVTLGSSTQKVARLTAEGRLGQDLGLEPSEVFSFDEPNLHHDQQDLELQLPDEELPASDIPLTLNNKVEYMVNFFQTNGRKSFAKWLSRSERYIPMMKEVLKKEGLPEDLVYVAMIESGFSPHAYSVANAVGPWQFISGTGKRYSLRIDPWIDERRDPLKSSVAAALYLKELYSLFNNDWYLATAGYNAGENKILRAINMYNTRDFWQISQGTYLKRETKDYVPKLLAAAIIAKEPAKYGFADVAYLPPIEFDEVTIPSRTDLDVVARLSDESLQTLRDLNPELRRWCTPPDYPDYQLKIPKGKKGLFEAEYARLPEDQRYVEKVVYVHYRATRKDTVASVARRYGLTPEALAEMNSIPVDKRIAGKTLKVPVPVAIVDPAGNQQRSPEGLAAAEKGVFKKYYTVQKGDTLASVSKKFNVSTGILQAWNNLKGRLALKPGKRIVVAKFIEKQGSMVADDDKS
jgi:membrane-bound lytic murein transglycosylase D